MPGVSLLSANVVTICIESLLYGIFLILSLASIYVLASRRRERRTSSPLHGRTIPQVACVTPMSIAALLLFMTNTAHWIIGVYRAFQAFIVYEGGLQPLEFFSDLRHPTEIIQIALLMMSLVIGDMMLVYRLWIIWAYNVFVILIPVSTLIGLTVCAVGVIYQISQTHVGEVIFAHEVSRWITANCVFTLCTNVYSTGFIAWRIYHANKRTERIGGTSLMGVVGILVESAALYTSWTIFFFVAYHVGSNLQFTVSDTYCAIAGISFMSINVRVGLGSGHGDIARPSWAPATGIVRAFQGRNEHLSRGSFQVVRREDGRVSPIKFASCSSVELSSMHT